MKFSFQLPCDLSWSSIHRIFPIKPLVVPFLFFPIVCAALDEIPLWDEAEWRTRYPDLVDIALDSEQNVAIAQQIVFSAAVNVKKLDQFGQFLWERQVPTAEDSQSEPVRIAVDNSDSIWVAGISNIVESFDRVWVARYDSAGNLLWFSETPDLGWTSEVVHDYQFENFAVEPDGSACYFLGHQDYENDLATGIGLRSVDPDTGEESALPVARPIFLSFDGSGNLVVQKFLPTDRWYFFDESDPDKPEGVIYGGTPVKLTTLARDGGVYAILGAGNLAEAGDPSPTRENQHGRDPDTQGGFLAKIDRQGGIIWIKHLTKIEVGADEESFFVYPNAMTTDPEGNVFVGGGAGINDVDSDTIAQNFFISKFSTVGEREDFRDFEGSVSIESMEFGNDGFLYVAGTKIGSRYMSLLDTEDNGGWIGRMNFDSDFDWAVLHPLNYLDLQVSPFGDLFLLTDLHSLDGSFIIRYGNSEQSSSGKVNQVVTFTGSYDPVAVNNKVFFVCPQPEGEPLEVEAEIVEVTETEITVRVPVGILGDRRDKVRFPEERQKNVTIRFERSNPGGDPTTWTVDFVLILPQPLLYDEIAIPTPTPGRHVLPQRVLNNADDIETFWFLGRSVDESVGLRIQNSGLTAAQAPLLLQLNGQTEVFKPSVELNPPPEVPGSLEIDRSADDKLKLNVSVDGLWVVSVKAAPESTFPAPFQIHLSGDTSSPQKILNDGQPEGPRAIRPDILYNHPAPRWERLTGSEANQAQTTLFKFAKTNEVSPYAVAVLIPSTPDGFTLGETNPELYLRRALDPDVPGQLAPGINDPTNPVARTPSLVNPQFGEVIDFTQLPAPASAIEEAADPGGATSAIGGTVGAVIGAPNLGVSVSLPFNEINTLILDMGSGQEIVDKDGNDLRVHAVGDYTVAVANTPFTPDFVAFPGTASGNSDFDLSSTGLSSARYVRIGAASSVQLDAVQALYTFYEDQFFDDLLGVNVPATRVERMTFTARREKAPATDFDPVLELIRPDGTLNQPIADQGFGDPTSNFMTDAALANRPLEQPGLYRVLGRGDRDPNAAAFGAFFSRLETGGDYDQNPINVPSGGEVDVQPQRIGTLSQCRERDSFVVSVNPGQRLNIVLSGEGNTPISDPILELHDPEGILIAANDNFAGRDRDAVISVTLPTQGIFGEALPSPSAYRIIVGGIDQCGQSSVPVLDSGSTSYVRVADSGSYSLKVFSGPLDLGPPDLRLSSTLLDFGEVTVDSPAFASLMVFNDGVGVLNVAEIDIDAGDNTSFTVLPGEFSLAPGVSRQVTIGFTPDSVGPFSADLTISSNDPDQLSAPVIIQANVSVGDGGGSEEEEASATLTSFSLRIGSTSTVVNETTYNLFLDSGFGESEGFNQELAYDIFVESPEDFLDIGADPEFPSHFSDITIESASEAVLLSGGVEINVLPAADSDANGIPDFFQPEIAIPETMTSGFFVGNLAGTVEFLDGTVLTTWTRDANSLSGTVRIAISITEGTEFSIEFNTTFELLRYNGTLTFVRDSESMSSGALAFSLENSPSGGVFETLSGDVSLTLLSSDELTLAGGELNDNGNPVFTYDPFSVLRREQHYLTGVIAPFDFPSAFGAWVLELVDNDDRDDDGVPNFSDEPGEGGGTPVSGIELWRSALFGVDADNPEIAGDLADNDFDDSPVFLEYGLNTDPNRSDSTGVEVEFTGGIVSLRFTRNPNANDIEYVVEESEGPAGTTWTTIASCLPGESWTSDPGVSVETTQGARGPRIHVSIPLKGRPLYYRLLVRKL